MAAEGKYRLDTPPIVEAIVDIDCDLPREPELAAQEGAVQDAFGDSYPVLRKQYGHEIHALVPPEKPASVFQRSSLQALRLFQEDERQLVQLRAQGFSFNRLAPYSRLDDYLPEIRRLWEIYRELARPVQIRNIRLRYINRIRLPMKQGEVDLDRFLTIAPRLPDDKGLGLTSFLVQQSAVDRKTGETVTLVLTDGVATADSLPVILDIAVESPGPADSADWQTLSDRIGSLRSLKNRIFWEALTEECIISLRS